MPQAQLVTLQGEVQVPALLCADCICQRYDAETKVLSAVGAQEAVTILGGRAVCVAHLFWRASEDGLLQ